MLISISNTAAVDRPALPPQEIAKYIYGGVNPEDSVDLYVEHGTAIRRDLHRQLGPEWSFDGKRILDFGCGSGRVLSQFLREAAVAEFHGCDIDAESVDWVRENLSPPLHVTTSNPVPPLPYADAFFDLIWATAVLSHLTDAWSVWLLELHRILKPGGRLIASVVGAGSSELLAGEPWDENRVGMNVLGYGRPWPAGGPTVLHSEWWIRAHWGRLFEIEKFERGGMMGQDAVVMRPLAVDGVTPADLERPEANEPRELTAALHAIKQLQRENRVLNESHDAYAKAYQSEAALRLAAERRSPRGLARKLLGRDGQ